MVLANFYCDTPVPPKWVNKIDHIPDYKVPKAKKKDGRSERAVRKQIMKTGDHGCDDGGHCNIYRSV